MCAAYAARAAHHGARVAWLVPTYRNARPCWRELERYTLDCRQSVAMSKQDMTWRFWSGGDISFFTDDNATAMRGESFDLCFIDEAAQIREDSYYDVVIPTLADRAGRCVAVSTPKGRNWFWREFTAGQDPANKLVHSFHAPTSDNPMPTIRAAFERAKAQLGESSRTFRQEWLAEFIEGGALFPNVRAICTNAPSVKTNALCVFGIDWGRTHDHTAISVFDVQARAQVALERFTGLEYAHQLHRVADMVARFNPSAIIAEQNSMGGPLVEDMQARGWPVIPFLTTNASKKQLVDTLEKAMAERSITLQADPQLIAELEAYEELKRTALGSPVYGAPQGMHDDCAMATMLSVWGATEHAPLSDGDYAAIQRLVS